MTVEYGKRYRLRDGRHTDDEIGGEGLPNRPHPKHVFWGTVEGVTHCWDENGRWDPYGKESHLDLVAEFIPGAEPTPEKNDDAAVWHDYAKIGLQDQLRWATEDQAVLGEIIHDAATIADGMLTEFRKRFPR